MLAPCLRAGVALAVLPCQLGEQTPRSLTGSPSLLPAVSDLQEEGKNAINAPMSPALVDLHPEDTLLGTAGSPPPVVCRPLMCDGWVPAPVPGPGGAGRPALTASCLDMAPGAMWEVGSGHGVL